MKYDGNNEIWRTFGLTYLGIMGDWRGTMLHKISSLNSN
jgi:hypothetical protein